MKSNQRNTNVRFGMSVVLAFLLCMCLSSWVATQYLASVLHYQEGLGPAAWNLGSRRLYQPFAWWFWNLSWMNETGELGSYITRTQIIAMCGALASVCVGIWMYYRRSMQSEEILDLHGSARWAELRDIELMKLISHSYVESQGRNRITINYKAQGVYVGAIDTPNGRMVLRYNEPAHLLCFAPSRSGKGVGPVLCTLLSYPHSTATNDIKGENFELSSGFRHTAGSLVIRFDPTALDQKSIDGDTRYNIACGWNVMQEIRIFTEFDEMDAQNIAAAIADPEGKGMEDHWVSTSFDLFTGVILHVMYFERDKSLTGVVNYLADPSFTDPEQMYNRMLDAEHDPTLSMGWMDSNGNPTKTHPAVAREARAMLNKEEKERNSVLSTAKTKLTLFAEPVVARNISRSDFTISDLMHHTKPVSLYIVIPPSDKDRLRPLVRLFITYLLRKLTKDMDFEDGRSVKNYRNKLLLLIDELASLKKLEQLQDGLSYIAGYGITAYLFVQDTIQLDEAYGQNQTITSGCQIRLAFAPNAYKTAEDLSKMTGTTTIKKQDVSYSGSRMSSMLGQMSVSEQSVERPLMTADEIMQLPRDEMLIFNAGHPPIRGKKLQYFQMPEFSERAKISSPSRVSMSYRDARGLLAGTWFMVLVQRAAGGVCAFDVSINCYADFPPMRVVVKQENLITEVVHEYEFNLVDSSGALVDRVLTVDDLNFRLMPAGDASGLNVNEAFEAHFQVKDHASLKSFSQKGFFRDMAVCEKELRRQMRDRYREIGMHETGEAIDVTIDKIADGGRYSGKTIIINDDFVVLENRKDIISIHRKVKLNTIPKVGDQATILYSGKKGRLL